VTNVLFVCVANSGRSVMAERIFRQLAGDRHQARSAGSEPGASPHPQVVKALREIGFDAADHVPRKLDPDALAWADIAVSTCSEEICPVTPGVRRISWQLPDPKNLPLEQVRPIRDEIERRVERLFHDLDHSPLPGADSQAARRRASAEVSAKSGSPDCVPEREGRK
jgi:arsenate reductase (thioredoxin)